MVAAILPQGATLSFDYFFQSFQESGLESILFENNCTSLPSGYRAFLRDIIDPLYKKVCIYGLYTLYNRQPFPENPAIIPISISSFSTLCKQLSDPDLPYLSSLVEANAFHFTTDPLQLRSIGCYHIPEGRTKQQREEIAHFLSLLSLSEEQQQQCTSYLSHQDFQGLRAFITSVLDAL